MQQRKPARKRRLRLAGGDDLGDDFQTAQQIGGAIGLARQASPQVSVTWDMLPVTYRIPGLPRGGS